MIGGLANMNEETAITIYQGEIVDTHPALVSSNNGEQAVIDKWLEVKGKRSAKTLHAYELTMRLFRKQLHAKGLDVFSQREAVASVAEDFVTTSYDEIGRVKGNLAEGTINQRRAILSSFYQYAHKYNDKVSNPIDLVEKQDRNVHYAADYIDAKELVTLLAQIDRSTLAGKRDYALLLVATTTGRRANELIKLTWGDVRMIGKREMELTFHCKGGKTKKDILGTKTRAALETYLHALYTDKLYQLPNETPIFVSLSRNNLHKPLSSQALSDICKKYLGSSQFHTTRHTWAMNMREAGASITEISKGLGHSDEKTTRAYLEEKASNRNRHITKLEKLYGL